MLSCATITRTAPTVVVPNAVDDVFMCSYNAICTVNTASGVLANDASNNGGTLTVTGTPVPSSGTLSVLPDGSFNFTPAM